MYRRALFPLLTGFVLASAAARAADESQPFDAATVRELARALAQKPYAAPDTSLPDSFKDLDYTAFQNVRFNPAKMLWHDQGARFTVGLFHRGYLFKDRVDLFEVVNGRATPIHYNSDMFDFGPLKPPSGDLGFAGFRVHYPLNHPDYNDEVCAFLGASYFRAVAKGQGYGLSARGLSIKTADPSGEEFPVFKRFLLERPAPGSDVLVIHALLDSPSAAAAFRFTVRPGAETVMDTEAALYPRSDLTQAGLAPMTSMFLFDANNRAAFDDVRAAVHDSNGMALLTGQGESIWRQLNNPRTLQISAFQDTSPRGFGFIQRERDFLHYQDLDGAYEKRPSLWVEPIGDWGQGAVVLIEIPSDRDVNDNMVGFWRPKDPLKAKGEYILSYRLHWGWDVPGEASLAKVGPTRAGLAFDQKNREFVVDFIGGPLKGRKPDDKPGLDLASDKGKVENAVLTQIPGEDTWRLTFQLTPGDEKIVEMHARLMNADKPISETWIYRWTV